jgi:hypothetical protein
MQSGVGGEVAAVIQNEVEVRLQGAIEDLRIKYERKRLLEAEAARAKAAEPEAAPAGAEPEVAAPGGELDGDADIARLRAERIAQLREARQKAERHRSQGHGEYRCVAGRGISNGSVARRPQ